MAGSVAVVHGDGTWVRALHDGTTLAADGAVVLARPPALPGEAEPAVGLDELLAPRPSLAADANCHLYRAEPGAGVVERYRLARAEEGGRLRPAERLLDWFAPDEGHEPDAGFRAAGPGAGVVPAGVAADGEGRVWVADGPRAEVLVLDRWSRRLLRRIRARDTGAARSVVDLAADASGGWAVVTGPAGLVRLPVGAEPHEVELPRPAGLPDDAVPVRVAAGRTVAVMFVAPGGGGWVVELGRDAVLEVPAPTDVEVLAGEDVLVVAGQPDGSVTRFVRRDGLWVEDAPLEARGYDGNGLVRLPDDTVAFWTARGLQGPLVGRGRYRTRGRVTTLSLDAGAFGARWGRVFVEARVPPGTAVRVHAATSDDDRPGRESPPKPPPVPGLAALPDVDPRPVRVPVELAPGPGDVAGLLHRRRSGRPEPWSRPGAADPFMTLEAPVPAPPGRYLWLTFELLGQGRATPRVRTVRAEREPRDHLRRLPPVYRRDPAVADYLARYLSLLTGLVEDLDARATARHVLVHPCAVPEEALAWLASFVGLALDDRWPLDARRRLVGEAVPLLRGRGTLWSLRRMLGILLGVEPVIVEHFRLRGVGAALLGEASEDMRSTSVVGAGFRVGGAVGSPGEGAVTGVPPAPDGAHQFSVLVPRALTPDEEDAVEHLLDVHRPAHTVVDVCTLGVGMRVGRGLHLQLSSLVGPTGAWTDVWLDRAHLGRDARLAPGGGPGVGSARLAETARTS